MAGQVQGGSRAASPAGHGWPDETPSSARTGPFVRRRVPYLVAFVTFALWTARILALAGFLDAAWLTASHFAGEALTCGPGGGCEVVLTSEWATVGDVPVAAIGLAYYVVATLIAWTPQDAWYRGIALVFAGALAGGMDAGSVRPWGRVAPGRASRPRPPASRAHACPRARPPVGPRGGCPS